MVCIYMHTFGNGYVQQKWVTHYNKPYPRCFRTQEGQIRPSLRETCHAARIPHSSFLDPDSI